MGKEFRKELDELDVLLRRALAPAEGPDERLNQRILNSVDGEEKIGKRERMKAEMEKRKWRRMPAVALTAAILVGAGSLTAYGAYRYLSLKGALEEFGDKGLEEAFFNECATVINETQSYGGYDVTLMGIASGENLTEYARESDGKIRSDRTYVIVAIARSDGSPMPDFGEPGEDSADRKSVV